MPKVGFLQDVIDSMKAGVYDFTVDGNCSNCGQCCTNFLPMTEKEVRIIKAHIKKHKIKEQKHFLPTAAPTLDFTCPFRNNNDRRCEIYDVRPAICRDFKCDNPKKGIKVNKNIFDGPVRLVRVRETFFGR